MIPVRIAIVTDSDGLHAVYAVALGEEVPPCEGLRVSYVEVTVPLAEEGS